jgi:hypothetical protein
MADNSFHTRSGYTFYPILLWYTYRYYKAGKEALEIRHLIEEPPKILNKLHASLGFGYIGFGQKVYNSVVLDVNGKRFKMSQLYIWFSNCSKQENLG